MSLRISLNAYVYLQMIFTPCNHFLTGVRGAVSRENFKFIVFTLQLHRVIQKGVIQKERLLSTILKCMITIYLAIDYIIRTLPIL